MSFRFNSGYGAVTCNDCNKIIDQGLGPDEYNEFWGGDRDVCMICREKRKVAVTGSRSAPKADGGNTLGGSSPSPSANKKEKHK